MNPLTETRVCRICGSEFESRMYRGTWQVFCPACLDARQKRPSVVVERNLLYGPVICLIDSLPDDWQPFQARNKDLPCQKIVVKGDRFGVAWSGRIDIFAPVAFAPGDVVELTQIEAVHKVRATYTARPTLEHGTVTVRQTRPVGEDVGEIEIEKHIYVRLDPVDPPSDVADVLVLPRLVWSVAHYKTTLKGYGRQYRNDLVGAPLWEMRVSGGVRSGRLGATGALALVDDDHPLEVVEIYDR